MVDDPIWEQVKKSVQRARCQPRRANLAAQTNSEPFNNLSLTSPASPKPKLKWQALNATPRLKSGVDYTVPTQSHAPPEQQQWWQALADKKQRLDGKLDLHGLTENQAYTELGYFMQKAATRGWRYVLIITGKGRDLQGALRGNLPKWLSCPPFHTQVQSFAHAHLRHGGWGAYYVALKPRK